MKKSAARAGPLNDKALGRNLQLGSMFDGRFSLFNRIWIIIFILSAGQTNTSLKPPSGSKVLSMKKHLSTTIRR